MYSISWFICRWNSKKYNIFRFSIDMNLTVSMQSNIICWQGNVHCWITGKYGLNFEIQNVNLQSKAQSEKQIPTLRNVSFFGKSEKGFEKKTVYKHSVLASAHTLSAEKKNTVSGEQFCKSLFCIPIKWQRRKAILHNPSWGLNSQR